MQLSLILDKIRRSEGIDVTADDLQKEYQQLAAQYGLPEREVKRYYEEDEARLEPFKDQLLDAKVIAFVKEKVKVKEV